MYLNIRKEEVKGLPSRFQHRGVKLFPTVKFDRFSNKYEQTWKFDDEGNYIRDKREPKWKYKVYLCGSYRVDGKARNKQILLETIYYWDIVEKCINVDRKQKQIFNMDTNEYVSHEFDESWLDLNVFENMEEEVFLNIREWIGATYGNDMSEQRVLCSLITDKLRNEIQSVEDDYKTTSEYKTIKENEKIIKECIKEVDWLNERNGFE